MLSISVFGIGYRYGVAVVSGSDIGRPRRVPHLMGALCHQATHRFAHKTQYATDHRDEGQFQYGKDGYPIVSSGDLSESSPGASITVYATVRKKTASICIVFWHYQQTLTAERFGGTKRW